MNISITMARQHTLALFRIINRQCFNGQLGDPQVVVDNDLSDRILLKKLNNQAVMVLPKELILSQDWERVFEMLQTWTVAYWLWIENTEVDNALYEEKLAYVRNNSRLTFIDLKGQGVNLVLGDKMTPTQKWCDDLLKEFNDKELHLLSAPIRDLKTRDRKRRKELHEKVVEAHTTYVNSLPRQVRFPPPTNAMTKRRAKDELSSRNTDCVEG